MNNTKNNNLVDKKKEYYQQNKTKIINYTKTRYKSLSIQQKEKLREYNRRYYNNVRKHSSEFKKKMEIYRKINFQTGRIPKIDSDKNINIKTKCKLVKIKEKVRIIILYGNFIIEF